jgi:hypothetical protein
MYILRKEYFTRYGRAQEASEHVPNHAGDLLRATDHLRAAVAKRRGRPPAAPIFATGEVIYDEHIYGDR